MSGEIEQRDQRVCQVVTDEAGLTTDEIAERVGVTGSKTYLALRRLVRTGSVQRRHDRGAHRWYPGGG